MKRLPPNFIVRSLPLLAAVFTLLAWSVPVPPAGAEGRAHLRHSDGDVGGARLFTSLSERRALDALQPPPPAAAAPTRVGERSLQIQPQQETVGEDPPGPLLLPVEAAVPAGGTPLPVPVAENRGLRAGAHVEAMHFDALISRRGWTRLWVNGQRVEQGEALPNGLEWTALGGLAARFHDRSGRSFDLLPGQELAPAEGGKQ